MATSTENITLREYTLSVNEFNQPKVLTDNEAIVSKLIELAMLEPGVYPTRPYMGLGLRSKYRYSFEDRLEELKQDYQNQIQTYLPTLVAAKVDIVESDLTLKFYITVDQTIYTLILDKTTKTLSSL